MPRIGTARAHFCVLGCVHPVFCFLVFSLSCFRFLPWFSCPCDAVAVAVSFWVISSSCSWFSVSEFLLLRLVCWARLCFVSCWCQKPCNPFASASEDRFELPFSSALFSSTRGMSMLRMWVGSRRYVGRRKFSSVKTSDSVQILWTFRAVSSSFLSLSRPLLEENILFLKRDDFCASWPWNTGA